MEIRNVALFAAAAGVLNAVLSTAQGTTWTYVYHPNGTIEHVNLAAEPEDSASTPEELEKEVIFTLFTKLDQSMGQNLSVQNIETLSASNFNARNPTRIIIHGWLDSMEAEIETSIRDAYLSVGEYNVILVDWNFHTSQDYLHARTKIVTVGEYVGRMIDTLEAIGCDLVDLTVVGHSLGAHVAGVAARSANGTVANLVGLDPAGPLFQFTGSKAKLRSTDADFVEVIHTSAGRCGYYGNLGDADYWVNGGIVQRGCGLDPLAICSHERSHQYFADSIIQRDNIYTAHTCSSYSLYQSRIYDAAKSSYMGGSTLDVKASGSYYLDTNSEAPFARGNVGPALKDLSTAVFGIIPTSFL